MSSPEQRKRDHVLAALAQQPSATPFDGFHLVHRCLPELALKEVDLTVNLFGSTWGAPLYINAMTGGYSEAETVNENLGALAAHFDIPLAVGSQKIALRIPELASTFTSVRKRNPSGLIWANLSADSEVSDAFAAVEMLKANALQLHLNAPQELCMPEGDRDFIGWQDNIAEVAKSVDVPVIAKEVGFGIAKDEAITLTQLPIAAIDVGGFGGTNFMQIEQSRHKTAYVPLKDVKWGIPTPISLIECLSVSNKLLLASGGIDTALSACIALALGASAVGLGRVLLQILIKSGEEQAHAFLERFIEDLRLLLAMQGCRTIKELQQRPVVITGYSREWLEMRGFAPEKYAKR